MKLKLTIILAFLAGPIFAEPTDYVPLEIWQRIVSLKIQTSVFAESTSKSLCFASAESSYGLGKVTNCIREISDGKNSLWIMRQNIETADRSIQNLIATYIDVASTKVPTAYYLELDRDLFEASGEFLIKCLVPCVTLLGREPFDLLLQVKGV